MVRRFPPAALAALVALIALLVAGCGGDDDGGGGASVSTADEPVTEFTIVAEDLRFDLDRIVVPAGEEVTATIENRDDGIGHNFSVALPGGEAKTEVEAGTVTQTLRFTVPEPGEHDFVCDPHAASMQGVVQAVWPPGTGLPPSAMGQDGAPVEAQPCGRRYGVIPDGGATCSCDGWPQRLSGSSTTRSAGSHRALPRRSTTGASTPWTDAGA